MRRYGARVFGLAASRLVAIAALASMLAACAAVDAEGPSVAEDEAGPPARITIRPDDYHVPYAGTAEDGRRFFLSDELFDADVSYVGLFLWKADGTFDEVRVDKVGSAGSVPPGQAASVGADDLVAARLAELGDYVLEPIEVAPFTRTVDGVMFGWRVSKYDDGTYNVNIEPGDFIAYYAPWDGLEYDT